MLDKLRACPKKYLTLIGSLFIYAALGTFTLTSSTSAYYLSYLLIKTKSEFARYSNTIVLTSLLHISVSLSSIIAGLFINKYKFSLKKVCLVGSLVSSLGFCLSFMTIKLSFLLFSITFPMMLGTSMGLNYIVPVSLVTKVKN